MQVPRALWRAIPIGDLNTKYVYPVVIGFTRIYMQLLGLVFDRALDDLDSFYLATPPQFDCDEINPPRSLGKLLALG